jgi:hypothetical protein
MFLRSRALPVREAGSPPPYLSRYSRERGIFNISQSYRPLRPVRFIAFYFSTDFKLGTVIFHDVTILCAEF